MLGLDLIPVSKRGIRRLQRHDAITLPAIRLRLRYSTMRKWFLQDLIFLHTANNNAGALIRSQNFAFTLLTWQIRRWYIDFFLVLFKFYRIVAKLTFYVKPFFQMEEMNAQAICPIGGFSSHTGQCHMIVMQYELWSDDAFDLTGQSTPLKDIWTETKWPSFRRLFKIKFLVWKLSYLDQNVT